MPNVDGVNWNPLSVDEQGKRNNFYWQRYLNNLIAKNKRKKPNFHFQKLK